MSTTTSKQRLNEMTENETNQRTITEEMNKSEMGGYELLLWHRHTCRHHACCCACAELRQLRCLLRQLSRGQRLAACY